MVVSNSKAFLGSLLGIHSATEKTQLSKKDTTVFNQIQV